MNINAKVKKKSKRPFKSKLKINTIKEIVINPNSGRLAYTFIEDNSCVDIGKCEIVKG